MGSKRVILAAHAAGHCACNPGNRGNARYQLVAAFAGLFLVAMSSFAAAQAPTGCKLGQSITDDRGNPGVIGGGRDELCLVKYEDGRTHSWISRERLSVASPAKTGTAAVGAAPPASATPAGSDGVVILRPTLVNPKFSFPEPVRC
jgi:hypothetical protein